MIDKEKIDEMTIEELQNKLEDKTTTFAEIMYISHVFYQIQEMTKSQDKRILEKDEQIENLKNKMNRLENALEEITEIIDNLY